MHFTSHYAQCCIYSLFMQSLTAYWRLMQTESVMMHIQWFLEYLGSLERTLLDSLFRYRDFANEMC
jgi:hypothetical protein